MTGASVSLVGHRDLANRFAKLVELNDAAAKREVLKAAFQVQKRAQRLIKQGGKGRVYTRRTVQHRASAPFDPPATDQGMLGARLTDNGAITTENSGFTAVYGPRNYPVAAYLEFGTQHMAPRPFLFRSLDEARPTILDSFAKAIAKATEAKR